MRGCYVARWPCGGEGLPGGQYGAGGVSSRFGSRIEGWRLLRVRDLLK